MVFDKLAPQPAPNSPIVAEYKRAVEEAGRAALALVHSDLNVAYGPADRHRLDIHMPRGRSLRSAPVVMFIHGGRWRIGYKEWNAFQAPVLTEMGAIFVSPQYGLSPSFRFPTPLEDILAAIAWVQANIFAYGGSPDRLYLAGHSAGGHLSALACVRCDLHGQFGVESEAIRGCLPISGSMNFDFDQIQPGSEEEEIRSILLADMSDAPLASPIRYVEAATSPFFISYGENDFARVVATDKAMIDALKACGADVSSYVFPGLGHFETHLDLARSESIWNQKLAELLRGG